MLTSRWRYKLKRLAQLSTILGVTGSLRFELLWSLKRSVITVAVRDIPTPVHVRRRGSDYDVFAQTFVDRELDIDLGAAARLVIDGGANVGYTTALLATRYPNATVIAVEPHDENCKQWRLNCGGIPNARLVQGGIWKSTSHLRIDNPDAESWAFHVVECTAGTSGSFPAYSVADLIEQSGMTSVDLLKLDIEGSEAEVLSSELESWIDRAKVIAVEVHGDDVESLVRESMSAHGFNESRQGEKFIFSRI